MGINLGDEIPNFVAETTDGQINFHYWLGNSWAMLFSHPRDFTPVCTTELSRLVDMEDEFRKRKVKYIALSCDSVDDHIKWSKDVQFCSKRPVADFPYPIIADQKRELAISLGMLDPDERGQDGMPLSCRAVFIIGPDKKLKASLLYPATTGRNFDEILRVIDSLQLTRKKKVATPVDWKVGDPCMVIPSVSPADAKKMFPELYERTVPSGKGYLRFTSEPKPNPPPQ